jgi:hypothetical protein
MIERTMPAVFLVACLWACGGSTPPPSSPAPAEPAVVEPAEIPSAPRHVTVTKVDISGGGIDEAAVKEALEAKASGFERCYAEARETTPEAEGRMILSYLYMSGERKSVSASHSGAGAGALNDCFRGVAGEVSLATDASAERTSIFVEMSMKRPE